MAWSWHTYFYLSQDRGGAQQCWAAPRLSSQGGCPGGQGRGGGHGGGRGDRGDQHCPHQHGELRHLCGGALRLRGEPLVFYWCFQIQEGIQGHINICNVSPVKAINKRHTVKICYLGCFQKEKNVCDISWKACKVADYEQIGVCSIFTHSAGRTVSIFTFVGDLCCIRLKNIEYWNSWPCLIKWLRTTNRKEMTNYNIGFPFFRQLMRQKYPLTQAKSSHTLTKLTQAGGRDWGLMVRHLTIIWEWFWNYLLHRKLWLIPRQLCRYYW